MMLDFLNWSVQELLDKAAAPAPEPGGGGVSAIAAGLGSGMLTMVARITADSPKYKDVEREVRQLIVSLEKNTETLKSLARQDVEAYNNFMAALALPKDTPEEKALREEKKQQAAKLSAEVPMEIARTCLANLKAAASLAAVGSKPAISDVGVGAYLLEACLKSALLMVDANLAYINDQQFTHELLREKEILVFEAQKTCQTALERVRSRMK
ncbi:Formiminotransferase-cyclodeaminase [Desulfotomaculum nigrificans CO-1-SRB]|uniref:Formiminotransferase-cyclodeaminase n=1 Tax=Desulfotomaculum nigrificans (strain DSM 14880 / VKM B-2319 / CO-1-SRB) TaxID=868595 RepID=F6B9Q0_DESCC|nr:cyclodeaminase/cyclohydrolase family protein [Desulfotomaculum nigrificans]AEF94946.1 Formiminotransferase-cyclodeaminase [Desulfotomaculum nigrificans CO-1-SRB]